LILIQNGYRKVGVRRRRGVRAIDVGTVHGGAPL
jgi:hypothetical protein